MSKQEVKQIAKMLASVVTLVTVGMVLTDKVLWPWVIAE